MGIIVDVTGELVAVREAYSVSAAQRHHFLNTETFGSKDVNDLRHGHGGFGQISIYIRGLRGAIIFAAEENIVVRTTNHSDEITGGNGENICAGNGVGTRKLEGSLSTSDEIEGVTGKGEVDVGITLGRVKRSRGDEDGSVTAIEDTIMEEEAQSSGGGGWAGNLLVCNGFLHDLSESWTGFVVVVVGKLRFGEECQKREGNQENEERLRHGSSTEREKKR